MLTNDLVSAKVRRGAVLPHYQDPADEESLDVAHFILEIFRHANMLRRREIHEQLNELLETSTELRFDKGLIKLCMDRSNFEGRSAIEPAELRKALFEEAVASRARGDFDRERIVRELSARFETPVDELEESLYADLKENERLLEFRDFKSAKALIERYNLALAQSVLLKAISMDVKLKCAGPPEYRRLFRALKFHRLLFRVSGSMKKGYTINIDGPMSLFSQSHRYGLRMANFLPSLLLCKRWSIKAQLNWGKGNRSSRRRFELDQSQGLKTHARDVGAWTPEELERLERRWPEDSDWSISRETEVIDLAGKGVLIPDFVFEKAGKTVYLDVMGYWNKAAALKRIALLRKSGPKNLVLAISASLCVDEGAKALIKELESEVYVFRSAILPKEIAKRLEIAG